MLKNLVGKTIKSVEQKDVCEFGDDQNVQTAFKITTTEGEVLELITDAGDVSQCYGTLETLKTGTYDTMKEHR